MELCKPVKRLIYVANARLPTEKAHGYQIVKMCEAFSQHNVEVVLLHPYRRQFDAGLRGRSVFDYYGVPPVFQIRTLTNLDVIPPNLWIPDRAFAPIVFTHALLWGFYAALVARREKADLYFTRDREIAIWLTVLGLPTAYEAHLVPGRCGRLLLKRIASHPALRTVVAVTSFIKERLVAMGFPAEKVIVLSDGVDLSLFHTLPDKKACRERLKLPQDRLILGYIGRFQTMEREKGIPELVQAMQYLQHINGSDPLLICVGGPLDGVPGYLELARRYGVSERSLRFIDRVPNREVPFWISACEVVTIPWPRTEFSAYFTSPLKLFEYMAAGVPIVASDLPSIRDILRHGENGWLVPPGKAKALADGIIRVLSDSRLSTNMANMARQEVAKYAWKGRAFTILDHTNRAL